MKASYSGRGSQPYNPEMLVALLFYGYSTGVFSSRKLERSTYDSVAFRYIAANNAQAGVDTKTMLIVAAHVTQHANDKLEVTPALANITALPKALGIVTEFIADCGYFSETNIAACEQKQITPYIAVDRQSHNQPLWDRFREPPPLPDDADAVTRMKHRLKTVAGKAVYAARKRTIEPGFGIIKSVMGFHSFLLRGFEAVQGEWDLVCIAWNIKRLHILAK